MQRLTQAALAAALLSFTPRAANAQEIDEAHADDAKPSDDARAAAEAKAAADATHLAHARGYKLTFRLGVRFLQTAPFSQSYQHVLSAYGYGSMSALLDFSGDVAISPWRWLDMGIHTGYAFGSGGTDGGSGGLLTLHAVELGGFAYWVYGRSDRRKPGTLAAGVEGGAMLPFLVLRGDVTSARLPYIAPVVLLRLAGDAKVQTTVSLRWLVANWSNAFGTVGLPLGGFSLGGGINFSL